MFDGIMPVESLKAKNRAKKNKSGSRGRRADGRGNEDEEDKGGRRRGDNRATIR